MNEAEQIQHLRSLVWNARLARARLKVGDPLIRAHARRLELFLHKIESRKIIPMPTKPYHQLSDYERRKVRSAVREVAAAFGVMLLLAGCVSRPFSDVSEFRLEPSQKPQTQKAIAAIPALPKLNSVSRSSVAPAKTNGVVTLTWNAGDPDRQTVIVNQSTGIAYPATTAETLTVGGLPIGAVQTFIATNSAGSSAPASTVVTPDTMKLQVQTWLYLTWPGPAGTLQQTTNLVIWQDVQPIPSGGSYIVTNNAAKAFYRVKL